MKKRLTAVGLALMMVVTMTACTTKKSNSDALPIGETPAYQGSLDAISLLAYNNVDGLNLEPGTYISIIGRSESGAFSDALQNGIAQAVADINKSLSYKGDDKLKVTYNAPGTTDDIDDQVNILDEELSRYPDAISIASIDSTAYTVQFDLAGENSIPIIAFDSGNSYDGILCSCKTDNNTAAATGASSLCDAIKDTGDVILIAHNSQSASASERVDGFTKELTTNHPNVKLVETIYDDRLEELKKTIADEKNSGLAENEPKLNADSLSDEDVITYYLEKHPNVKGVFGTNDATTELALSANKQLKDQDKAPVLMGFDSSTDLIAAVKDGTVQGLVLQNPFGMGYATVVACARTILGQGNEAVVNTGYTWVTKDNIDTDSVKNMLYK